MLDPREAKHAAGSRRLREGDTVILFDGSGMVAEAKVAESARPGRMMVIVKALTEQPAPAPPVHLGCALPRGDRVATLLSMTTQLGIASFTPLDCERSVAGAGRGSESRWRRITVEACKQSRQAHVPKIEQHAPPGAFIRAHASAGGALALVAHPGGEPLAHIVSQLRVRPPGARVALAIGPEGGFTDAEVAEMHTAGGRLTSLGSSTLRIETAATATVACLRIAADI